MSDAFESMAVEAGLNWETSFVLMREVSEKRAWRVAFIALFLLTMALGSLLLLLPLKQVIPYLIAVDRATGQSELVSLAADQPASLRLIESKYWVSQYVRVRERYDANWLDLDYQAIHRWSSKGAIGAYDAFIRGQLANEKHQESHLVVRITILSIGLLDEHHAQVRFERLPITPNGLPPIAPLRGTANLVFDFHPPLTGKERELMENPLGFQVSEYRVDNELVDSTTTP